MRVERLRLPALAEDNDPLGRRPGEALCPQRFDENTLAGIRDDPNVGPRGFAALYQQRPIAKGGALFKDNWLRYYSSHLSVDGDVRYELDELTVRAEQCWRFATFDPAFTKGKRSDYCAIGVFDVAPTNPTSLITLEIKRVRVESNEHVALMTDVWNRYKPAWVGIEKQNAMLSTWAEVQRKLMVVRWLQPDKNKYARAETGAAIWEAGRFWVPQAAPWLLDYIDELTTFDAGAHDDQVDVTAYACIELAKRTVRAARQPKPEPASYIERCRKAAEKRRKQQGRFHPILGRM